MADWLRSELSRCRGPTQLTRTLPTLCHSVDQFFNYLRAELNWKYRALRLAAMTTSPFLEKKKNAMAIANAFHLPSLFFQPSHVQHTKWHKRNTRMRNEPCRTTCPTFICYMAVSWSVYAAVTTANRTPKLMLSQEFFNIFPGIHTFPVHTNAPSLACCHMWMCVRVCRFSRKHKYMQYALCLSQFRWPACTTDYKYVRMLLKYFILTATNMIFCVPKAVRSADWRRHLPHEIREHRSHQDYSMWQDEQCSVHVMERRENKQWRPHGNNNKTKQNKKKRKKKNGKTVK